MRSSTIRTSLLGVATAGLLLCLDSAASAGTVTVTLREDGGGSGIISLSVSGSLDWVGAATSTVSGKFISPTWGNMGFTTNTGAHGWWSSASFANGKYEFVSTTGTRNFSSVWGNYGTGGDYSGITYTGHTFRMWTDGIAVDNTLTSGATISGSGTIIGDFTARGITAGTVTTVFKLGSTGLSNTVVIQTIAANAVPGVGGLAALACGAAGMPRRRRRVD